jgi:hypothetical protein
VGHSAPAVRSSKLADYLHGVVPNRLDTANMARLVSGIDTVAAVEAACVY